MHVRGVLIGEGAGKKHENVGKHENAGKKHENYCSNKNINIDSPRRVLSMIFERDAPAFAFIRTVASRVI